MAITFSCLGCDRLLSAQDRFSGRNAECPFCGKISKIPAPESTAQPTEPTSHAPHATQALPTEVDVFLDPPEDAPDFTPASKAESTSIARRLFEALLDPRSIQWMLIIGGSLCVLGLVIWLVSLGVFKDPAVLAAAFGLGTLAILGAGWFVTVQTRFRVAGQALTFLGCVVAPLNLWFYHVQGLMTVDGHLWIGGVVCCLLYAGTVYVLRDPLFNYASEAGITLTTLLLLADMGKITDTTWLSLFFMALGLISIHAERMFSPDEESLFPRNRFGLPLFWSGHVQIAASLIILTGTQVLGWFADPARELFGIDWAGNLLTTNHMLAAGIWLAGVYAYIYSDVVVRQIGVYLAAAAACLVMAEVTLLLGVDLQAEWIIAVMAITSLSINVALKQWPGAYQNATRYVPPIAWILGSLPVAWGIVLHLRATSSVAESLHWDYATGGLFVVVMLVAAVTSRLSAYLYRHTHPVGAISYFVVASAALMVAGAGGLRVLGLEGWSEQAPWMMIIPIGYLVAARLWRGHTAEKPCHWVAQMATGVILFHGFAATLQNFSSFAPMEGVQASVRLALVFGEAAAFYLMAGIWRKRSANFYLAAIAGSAALWQALGYYGVDDRYFGMIYAGLGLACIVLGRVLGIASVDAYRPDHEKLKVTRGRGLAAFQSGNGILLVACLSATMQGLAGLALKSGEWLDIVSLLVTTAAAGVAIVVAPGPPWRRIYATACIALGAIVFLRLNLMIDLTGWQKLEIFCVAAGLLLLTASHLGMLREKAEQRSEGVGLGLGLGSVLATVPLLIAVLYYRWEAGAPSLVDEIALLTVTIAMLVSGLSLQVKGTTLCGGGTLSVYLIVLIGSLAYTPQVAIGVYLAVGGAAVFGLGIALSVYRARLLELPERAARREGVFRILNWR